MCGRLNTLIHHLLPWFRQTRASFQGWRNESKVIQTDLSTTIFLSPPNFLGFRLIGADGCVDTFAWCALLAEVALSPCSWTGPELVAKEPEGTDFDGFSVILTILIYFNEKLEKKKITNSQWWLYWVELFDWLFRSNFLSSATNFQQLLTISIFSKNNQKHQNVKNKLIPCPIVM